MPQNLLFVDRRKFVWDGEAYDSHAAAEAKKGEYESQGFETQTDRGGREVPPLYAPCGERGGGRRRAPAGMKPGEGRTERRR